MKNLHIFGMGEYAEVAMYHFGPRLSSFVVNEQYLTSHMHLGFPVVSWEKLDPTNPLFIALGGNRDRTKIYQEAKRRGFRLADLVSPDANIRHAEFGDHVCILEYNNIQPFVEIGNNCAIWSGNHIGHHTTIGNHCFITSHVIISGGVKIGDGTFIGANATIYDHITIGADCLIQAASVVDRDVPAGSVWTREGLSKVPSSKVKL